MNSTYVINKINQGIKHNNIHTGHIWLANNQIATSGLYVSNIYDWRIITWILHCVMLLALCHTNISLSDICWMGSALCSQHPMIPWPFLELFNTRAIYFLILIFCQSLITPKSYIIKALCFHGPMFSELYSPAVLCNHSHMFWWSCIPRALCFHGLILL